MFYCRQCTTRWVDDAATLAEGDELGAYHTSECPVCGLRSVTLNFENTSLEARDAPPSGRELELTLAASSQEAQLEDLLVRYFSVLRWLTLSRKKRSFQLHMRGMSATLHLRVGWTWVGIYCGPSPVLKLDTTARGIPECRRSALILLQALRTGDVSAEGLKAFGSLPSWDPGNDTYYIQGMESADRMWEKMLKAGDPYAGLTPLEKLRDPRDVNQLPPLERPTNLTEETA